MTASTIETDVAIVGAGPVGAVLAGLLGLRGLRVTVVDREFDVFPDPRAAHIDHTALRALQELHCLSDLLPAMLPNPGLDFLNAQDELIMRVPADQRSVSGLPLSMYFHQPGFDRKIREVAAAMPTVSFHVGTDATTFTSDENGVELTAIKSDGTELLIRAPWLVGCDGGSGPVRDWLGIPLEDLGFEERWLVVNLILDGEVNTLPDRAIGACDPARPLYSIPMPAPRHRFEFMLFEGELADEMQHEEHVFQLLDEWVDRERYTVERSAVYTLRGTLATTWRNGRALLAGDAAHQMPPFLGQGMCSGIRDAVNLAWKLDQILRRGAPTEILDSYTPERRPHVREVAMAAIGYGKIVCTTDPAEVEERDRNFAADPRPPEQRITFRLPRLEPGPLVLDGGGDLFVQPLVEIGEEGLDDVIGQRFLVLARSPELLAACGSWWEDSVGALVTTLDETPEAMAPAVRQWLDRRVCDVVVVRPDRYVLGRGDDLEKITIEVSEALTGAPWTANVAEPEIA